MLARSLRTGVAVALLALPAAPARAAIATATLRIDGSGLEIVTTSVATGLDLPVSIQTSFAGKENDEAPHVDGVVAVGELTGPGLDAPLTLTTAPGHRFEIPGLPREGTYMLQGVRLMKGPDFLQYAVPSAATIVVADLLKTKVSVRQLSPDEIRARGISIDARSMDVYELSFTVLLASGEEIVIPYPVIVDPRTHQIQSVPTEKPYALPPEDLLEPPRWTPPRVVPFEWPEEEALPQPGKDPVEKKRTGAPVRLPAALVMPANLAALHQFFAVALLVTNNAPESSSAVLTDVRATMHIPTALRTVKTVPEVAFGQPVPIVDPVSGQTFLVAQAQGEAEWTLEGLQAGTHRIDFDLRAVLRQPGQVDVPLRATPCAAVVVHDARFQINFSHPATVRKGIDYSTWTFVSNLSPVEQSLTLTSDIPACESNPLANVCRLSGGAGGAAAELITLGAGEMKAIEYHLRPNVTGQAFATAGTISDPDNVSASVSLTIGVSESGIPLSPATLLLPHYAQFVPAGIVTSSLQLLGLGYSLATAPLNQVTAALPRVIATDVFQRAVDLARAGQRIFITSDDVQQRRDSVAHLALDLLGNGGYELREWDALRRLEKSGRAAGASLARQLESDGLLATATMASFFDDFSEATAHRTPFAAVLVHGGGTSDRPYALALKGRATGRITAVPNEAGEGWIRELPYADLSSFDGAGERGELALIGRWGEDLDAVVTPAAAGAFSVELLFPDAGEGHLLRARLDLTGTDGQPVTIAMARGETTVRAILPGGGIAAIATATVVNPAPLAAVAARQDLYLDPEGHKVSLLFNRPADVPSGVDLRGRMTAAIDFDRDGVQYSGPRSISAAALQDDRRTINLTLDHSLSTNAGYRIEVGQLLDPLTSQPFEPGALVPIIDNDAPAGIVYGKVLKGDNTPVAGADVVLQQYLPGDAGTDPRGAPQYEVSQAGGAFLFEFVRRQIDLGWSGSYRLEGFSSANGHAQVEGAVRLPGRVHLANLQFLGRGSAEGTVRYDDGSPVAGARVVVGSTMFDQFRSTTADASGFYRVDDLPVGPLTFSARDGNGDVTYAASEIATPGQLVTQNLSIYRQPFPGKGRVHGVVRRSDTNAPVRGARVGVSSQGYGLVDDFTDDAGRFDFGDVPAGFVTLLAAEWSVARQSVVVDLDLRADEVREQNLLLFVQPEEKTTTVTGEVWREKAAQPGAYERVASALVKVDGYRIVTADAEGRFAYENLPLRFGGRGVTAWDPVTQRTRTVEMPTLSEAGPNHVGIFIAAADRGKGTIRVRLLSAAGTPVSGYRVLVPGFPPDVLDETAPGIYEIGDVAAGTARKIWAVPAGIRPAEGPDNRPYGDQFASGEAMVQFNGQIAALTLRLPGEGTVRVRVRSQFDLIAGVTLSYPIWWEGEQKTITETFTASTEQNGQAGQAVFGRVPALTGWSVASAHPQYGSAGANGTLAYQGDFDDLTLQLNTLSSVRGTVYAIDGVTPVPGATVRISNGRSDPGPQITGPAGTFEFTNQPSSTVVSVTAEVTRSGVYRIGAASARTPANGGVLEGVSVILRRRGSVDGRVVYRDYRRFDPDNPANNVADDTPADLTDNAPAPLARLWLRELDFPRRAFGSESEPLTADATGRFSLSSVFVGSLRARAWDAGNEELRGDWTGRIDDEGGSPSPEAIIAIGGGGIGSLEVTVVDPNQSYAGVQNAEVSLYTLANRLFDFTSADANGETRFDSLPAGTYRVSAYSKSLGKTTRSEQIAIFADTLSESRLELEFSGTVDGSLTDPESGGDPVPGAHVRLEGSNYQTQATTDTDGLFLFEGVREGTFELHAKDTDTNRRASAERSLSVLDPHRTVDLELEPTETLRFEVYLPDDTGGNSGILAPPLRVEAVQRCWKDLGHRRHCDYERELQGNPLEFPGTFENSGWQMGVFEPDRDEAALVFSGAFPLGSVTQPFVWVQPAFGEIRVRVSQGGTPASGARVQALAAGAKVVAYTDADGLAVARGLRLGSAYVQVTSLDGRFTGAASTRIERQSVPAEVSIALGTYAAVTGLVEAESGGASVATRVIAAFGSATAEMRTDDAGRYTFLGIPTPPGGSTTVALAFVGPDDVTIGGAAAAVVSSGDVTVSVPTVRLDATPPQLVGIVPVDGASAVSPDSVIVVTFSEPLDPAGVTPANFQLVAADGSGNVACALSVQDVADGGVAITMTPPKPQSGFPLRSNTLYRVVVSGNVRDLTGHTIGSTRGFTFTTSDYAEPRVLKALPLSPIPRATTFEFRFNEAIDLQPWESGGNGAFHIYELAAPGGAGATVELELAGRAFVDPATSATLFIVPAEANPIEPESFYRVTFSGVRDPQGNALGPQSFHFFSFDEVAPHLTITNPTSGQELISGSEYEIGVELRSGGPAGPIATDVAVVRYSTIGSDEVASQFATATKPPWTTKIVGPEAPAEGTSLKVGAQATDASGNEGAMTVATWPVRANAAPKNVAVRVDTASVYPTKQGGAAVTFEDEGTFASVTAVFATPRSDGSTETRSITKSVTRNAGGTWPEVRFTHTLPVNAAAGQSVTVTARVTDVRGLASDPASATIAIAADILQPFIVSVTPAAETEFSNGASYVIDAIVRDDETTVTGVIFRVDGTLVPTASSGPGPQTGTQKFRSASVETRSKAEDAAIPIVVAATDANGNTRSTTFDVLYRGVNDPDAPKVGWLCPIDGAAIPANAAAFPLRLRLRVVDEDVRSVKFVVGDGPPVDALQVSPEEYELTHIVNTPDAGSLQLRAIVEDTVASHRVEAPVALDLVDVDFTFSDPKAITASEASTYDRKSVAVAGPAAVLAPQASLRLANLLVLNGARVESLPSTISREFRLELSVDGVTYVDCQSSIDVREKGYVGGWAATSDGANASSRGRLPGNIATGADLGGSASHAGLAGTVAGAVTNDPYGSIIAPAELGAGGGGSASGTAGAAGGGLVAIRGGSGEDDLSHVVIAGSILANGGSGAARAGAGAGGSVSVVAKSVVLGPGAVVSASGGDDDAVDPGAAGAGGGRIAIAAAERLELSSAALEARGGRNLSPVEHRRVLDGGAGTVFVRRPGQEAGELTVSSCDGRYPSSQHLARSTPLGRIGTGVSTSIAPSALTDAGRTFDRSVTGEALVLEGNTTRRWRVTGVSADGHTLELDPRDGDLQEAAGSPAVAYAGLLAFDRFVAGARSLAVFDEHVAVESFFDDKAGMAIDASAAVLLLGEKAVLTLTSDPEDEAITDTSIEVKYSVEAAAGVERVELEWPLDPVQRIDSHPDHPVRTPLKTIALPVPHDAASGPATLRVRAVDRAGRSHELPETTFDVVPNTSPVVESLTATPEAIHAGHEVAATIVASDDVAVKTIALDAILNGTVLAESHTTPDAGAATQSLIVSVPPDSAGGSTLEIRAAAGDGFPGRSPAEAAVMVPILVDAAPPALSVISPAAGSVRETIDTIAIRATAIDAEVAVKEVLARFDGDEPVSLARIGTTDDWSANIPAPAVDGPLAVERVLTVVARDFAGNESVSDPIRLTIEPVIDPNAPILRMLCGSSGAIFPPGYGVKLKVAATQANPENPVQSVEIAVDDQPLAVTAAGGRYEATFVVPPDAADGRSFAVRVVGRSAGGATSDLFGSFAAAKPDIGPISTNFSLGAADPAWEGKAVLVTGGTVTVSGAHVLDRLMLLGGSVVAPAGTVLDVTTSRELYVGCDAQMNMSGRGYARSVSYPGVVVPGEGSGGSHLGQGGLYQTPVGGTFGSIYRPSEQGGGGGNAGAGGGVVRLDSGVLVIDGAVLASGTNVNGGGGGGGSVWITAERVGGAGRIEASGGAGTSAFGRNKGAGGGGAITVDYQEAAGPLPEMRASSASAIDPRHGGAGSILVIGPGSTDGDVVFDNTGIPMASSQSTMLPALGTGAVVELTGPRTFTTDRASFPSYFAGHAVSVVSPAGATRGTSRIASISGGSMTLEEDLGVEPGDGWRGVYLFDSVTLRNARVVSLDEIRGDRDLDATSSLVVNDPPWFEPSKRTAIAVVSDSLSDRIVSPAGAVTDPTPPIVVAATNRRTKQTWSATAAADGSFAITVGGQPGDGFTIVATDSFSRAATSAPLPVQGAIANTNGVAAVSLTPAVATGGSMATATVRLQYPARNGLGQVSLSSSSAAAVVPAGLVVPDGNSSARFDVMTSAVDARTPVTITAESNSTSQSALITLLPASLTLAGFDLASSEIIGGESVNATLTLAAPAPAGGIRVETASLDSRLAEVPEFVDIPEAATTATFTVTTFGVASAAGVSLQATLGATLRRTLTLSPCSDAGVAPQPGAIVLGQSWFDESVPAGAVQSGNGTVDTTQAASGAAAVHLTLAGAGERTFSFSGGAQLQVAPDDLLVAYALIDPCDPPRQLLITWKSGAAEFRASWGETRIEPATAHARIGALPRGGLWARLEVLARALGIDSNRTLDGLSLRTDGGETWLDAFGTMECGLSRQPAPPSDPREAIWFDDEPPPGAVLSQDGWSWDDSQAAGGSRSHVTVPKSGLNQHGFTSGAPMRVGQGDVLFAWVLLDPCDPPEMVALQWSAGADGEHRAFWGTDRLTAGTIATPSRYPMGASPAAGRWVRLEVPAALVGLEGTTVTGAAFAVYNGRAFFDRSGRAPRVNVALGKTASQSSYLSGRGPGDEQLVVNGELFEVNYTASQTEAWWQVDLGATQPIDAIHVYNRSDAQQGKLTNYWVWVSDAPFTSSTVSGARAQEGVSGYWQQDVAGRPTAISIGRTGRFVRIQLAGTNNLHMAEVQVWAPVAASPLNVGGGRVASQSSTGNGQTADAGVNGVLAWSLTNANAQAWWQLDLGSIQPVGVIDIGNAFTSQFVGRMTSFYLLVSDSPFDSTALAATLAQPGVSAYYYGTPARVAYSFPVHRRARYVRLQLTGTNLLHPTEVRILARDESIVALGAPGASPPSR